MSCSNCFNGCSEIVSDRCVKYTGIDVPVLGIKTGDSLSYVEQALIEFLTSTLDGSGIKPDIDPTIICNLVKQYLPTCGDLTVVDLITALIKAACDLQVQIDAIVANLINVNSQLNTIEADYDVKCLTDVTPSITPSSGTHAIVQATIDSLCAFILNVETNYVAVANINTYIAAYLALLNPGGNTFYKDRMVPYTAVEYYDPNGLSNFDTTGAGLGDWDRIFLCNGLNGTPDKRGRVGVGAIVGVPGAGLDPAVNPLTPTTGVFNPNYSLFDKAGSNSIILTKQEMPLHAHAGSSAVTNLTPATHNHTGAFKEIRNNWQSGGTASPGDGTGNGSNPTGDVTITATTNLTITPEGGDLPHANNQPALACYYIMYIP